MTTTETTTEPTIDCAHCESAHTWHTYCAQRADAIGITSAGDVDPNEPN